MKDPLFIGLLLLSIKRPSVLLNLENLVVHDVDGKVPGLVVL